MMAFVDFYPSLRLAKSLCHTRISRTYRCLSLTALRSYTARSAAFSDFQHLPTCFIISSGFKKTYAFAILRLCNKKFIRSEMCPHLMHKDHVCAETLLWLLVVVSHLVEEVRELLLVPKLVCTTHVDYNNFCLPFLASLA